jgi:Fe-S cluster biogenesis protein NfuA
MSEEAQTVESKVREALDRIRPNLQSHGGDVEFVSCEDGVVTVRLQGACAGCPMAQMTLQKGVEAALKQAIPEVKEVRSAEELAQPEGG